MLLNAQHNRPIVGIHFPDFDVRNRLKQCRSGSYVPRRQLGSGTINDQLEVFPVGEVGRQVSQSVEQTFSRDGITLKKKDPRTPGQAQVCPRCVSGSRVQVHARYKLKVNEWVIHDLF